MTTERQTQRAQTQRAMPVLDCSDIARSVVYYRDTLGFAASTFGEPPTFAILQRGTVTLGLAIADKPAVSRNWTAYVYVANADALHAEFNAHGAGLTEPPADKPYNCRDFTVDDPDGHLIAFGHVLTPDRLGPGLSDSLGRDGDTI